MGTNFYFFTENKSDIKDLSRNIYSIVDEPRLGYEIHIAKTSAGWLPLFQANEDIRSVVDIKKLYDSGDFHIYDEYGTEYSWMDFENRVLKFNGGANYIPISHLEYEYARYASSYFIDADGYVLTEQKFC